jgi:arsenate reductase
VGATLGVKGTFLKGSTMKATIWHNPACGTSRKTLAILQETPGIELTIIEYLKQPYTADKLRQLFAAAGLAARDALRLRGTDAEERGLKDASEDAIIAEMAANPAYVERPIVQTDKGVRLCRPQDVVCEIL